MLHIVTIYPKLRRGSHPGLLYNEGDRALLRLSYV